MNLPFLIDELKVNLLNAAFVKLGIDWNYNNIISPFSRIYLITAGKGYLMPNQEMVQLKPGYLYLIPSYTPCSYYCVDDLEQYYIHFTNHLSDGLKIFDYLPVQHQVIAQPVDNKLFERLIEINPSAALNQADPSLYEKRNWMKSEQVYTDPGIHLETIGILKQILSRFIKNSTLPPKKIQDLSMLRKILNFIELNLHREIKIEELAQVACYSTDHFTRQFKKTTGKLPLEYINRRRIEKAQILLLTTSFTQKEISEKTGFNSLQYYNAIFKQFSGAPPAYYRKMGGLV